MVSFPVANTTRKTERVMNSDRPLAIDIVARGACRSGGAEVYTGRLFTELRELGHDVHLFGFEIDECFMRTGCATRFPAYPTPARGIWRLAHCLRPRQSRQMFTNIAERKRPADVAIISDQPLGWGYHGVFRKTPMVYIPHSLLATRELQHYQWDSHLQRLLACRTYGRLEKWLLGASRVTVRFTETSCDEMRRHYGSNVANFRVIPQAVDAPLSPPTRDFSNRALKCVSVGRLVPSKNVELAIRALSRHPNYTLDVVGDGPDGVKLSQLADKLGVRERIQFHGHCASPERFYDGADLLLFPSRLEYAPLVVLEAMGHGVIPIVMRRDARSYFNANHELIRPGVNGFLCDDEEAFMDALININSLDATELASISTEARTSVVPDHTWSHHVLALLEFILASSGRDRLAASSDAARN